MTDQNRFRKISIVLFVLALIMLAVHIESIVRFNRREITVHGNDQASSVHMEIDARKDSTSRWEKRDYPLEEGTTVDLTGQTIDGTILNHGDATVQDWGLRINIHGDCFINQAWNGEVEIHQFTGTEKEKVQRMNLQNYRLEDVTLEYRFDGDLLIPLQEGDYVIYYPSARFNEMPVRISADVRIGMILYYLDEVDLTDYDFAFHYHREFTQGITFYPFVALAVLWLLSSVIAATVDISYRRARKEMELRKSGIFSMSDIYDAIYIIHLSSGEMTPVSVDEKLERNRPKNQTAKELLTNMIRREAEEKYRSMTLEFVDTDTLAERLKNRSSVVCEFRSKTYGWYSIRFFAVERVDDRPLEDVIFAVQNISEEKKELEAITAQIAEAESASKSRSALMENVAGNLHLPLEKLLERIDRIVRESGEKEVRDLARGAHSIASRLLILTDGLTDSSNIQSGRMHSAVEAYSLRRILTEVLRDILPLAEQHQVSLTLDAAETLPDHLRGNARLLEEALVNLISCLIPAAGGGKIQLSVYGKTLEGKVHLLFSARSFLRGDSPAFREETLEIEAKTRWETLNMEVVATLLSGMGSALRTVSSPSDRSEFYFETEQEMLDPTPIGKISIEDAATEPAE